MRQQRFLCHRDSFIINGVDDLAIKRPNMFVALLFILPDDLATRTINWKLMISGKMLFHISNALQCISVATAIRQRSLLGKRTRKKGFIARCYLGSPGRFLGGIQETRSGLQVILWASCCGREATRVDHFNSLPSLDFLWVEFATSDGSCFNFAVPRATTFTKKAYNCSSKWSFGRPHIFEHLPIIQSPSKLFFPGITHLVIPLPLVIRKLTRD